MRKLLLLSSGGIAAFLFSCGPSTEVHVKKESAPVYVLKRPETQLFRCPEISTSNIYVKVNTPNVKDKYLTLKVAKSYISQNNLVTLSPSGKGATKVVFDISKLDVEKITGIDRVKEKATLIAQVNLETPKGKLCKASKPIEEEVIYQKPTWDNSPLPSDSEIKEKTLKLAMEEVLGSLLPKRVLTVRPLKMDSSNAKVVGNLVMHKKYDKAINVGLKKEKASKKVDASLLYNIGVAYEAKAWTLNSKDQIVKNLEKAKAYYNKALQVNKKDKDIHSALKDVENDLELLK